MIQCQAEDSTSCGLLVQGNYRSEPMVIKPARQGVCDGQPVEYFTHTVSGSDARSQIELASPEDSQLISGIQEQRAKEMIKVIIQAFPEAIGFCLVVTCEGGGEQVPTIHHGGKRISDVFDFLGYATYHVHNPSKDELATIYSILAKDIRYPPSYSRLIFFFRGHGVQDHISTEDGFINISWLISLFKSPAIIDIPKIFIFDCCRDKPLPGYKPYKTEVGNVLVLYTTLDGCRSFIGSDGVADPTTLLAEILKRINCNLVEVQKKLHDATLSSRERDPDLYTHMQPVMETALHDSIYLLQERLDSMRPTGINLDVGYVKSSVTWEAPPHASHQHLKHYDVCVRPKDQTTVEWASIGRTSHSTSISKLPTSWLIGCDVCVQAVYEDGTTVESLSTSFPRRWTLRCYPTMLKSIPLCPVILCIMFIVCLITSMVYYNHTSISPDTQMIVAGQVITQPMLAPLWLDTLWYEGVSIHHRRNGLSDNLAMLISVVNAEDIDVITHKELVCDMYPANKTVYNENGEISTKRTIFPLNYLVNPMYFVRESSIILLLRIYLSSVVNNLYKATLYIFNSDDKVRRFLSGERNVKPIRVMDVSGIARKESLYYYNVVEDGYLFFAVELNTSANYFTLFSNITSELNSYIITGVRPNNMSRNTFGLNGSVFFQFTRFSPPKKMIFLYAHPVEDLELPLTHLILTYRPRSGFKILVVVLLSCAFSMSLICFCICICINLRKKDSCPRSYERLR